MITVNKDVKRDEVEQLATEAINQIIENAQNGRAVTKLSFDRQIAGDVRREITERLDKDGTYYSWLILRTEPNMYGRMQSFTSETIGNTRYYKLKIHS